MFEYIKKIFLKRYLAENKPEREKRVVSIKQAKQIALLCEITDEDSYKDIFRIFTRLQDQSRTVKLIGYVDDKTVPFYCLPQLTAEYFCHNHLNWYGKPNMEQLYEFVQTEYDMLIDCNYRYHAATVSLLTLSNAKFIVGREPDSQCAYDLYFNAVDLSNSEFIENVDVYTQKLMGYDK